MRVATLVFCGIALGSVACSNDQSVAAVGGAEEALSTSSVQTSPVVVADFECPVTPPNGVRPDGRLTATNYHGNDGLTTALWPDNIISVSRSDQRDETPSGAVSMKFPWWLPTREAELVIEGRRLDEPALPLTAHIPDGYSGRFQASGLNLPSPGCWEVTARSAGATLRFVTLVVETP